MMIKNKVGEVLYLTFPLFDKISFVYHAFSTRQGGVSQGIYSSMNLSFGRGDEDGNVRRNYAIFCDALGIGLDTLVFSDQTHTSNIRAVSCDDRGTGFINKPAGFDRPKPWHNVDGLVTGDAEVTLVTHYADCVPLFFVDPVRRVVATAHAGWKGTVLGISAKMVETMQNRFSSDPKEILVGIGPCIGMCCFEVDEITAEKFQSLPEPVTRNCIRQRPDPADPSKYKYDIDLQEINKNLLLQSGIAAEHIETADICTKCNPDWLFSHRASNGQRGGLAAIIGIKK